MIETPGFELQKDENAEAHIVIAELETALDQQRAAGNKSYAELIPDKQRGYVINMAKANHKYFKNEFPEEEDFIQAFCRNWLLKKMIFEKTVKTAQFQEMDLGNIDKQRWNRSAMAFLTESGSYVLIGAGAFDSKGPGAPLKYQKIPLRADAQVEDFTEQSGNYLQYPPEENEPLRVKDKLTTSPIISAWNRPMDIPEIQEQGAPEQTSEELSRRLTTRMTMVKIERK
ncbi:hypothetical protein KGQ24_02905 [Patescibacteria group bacterium]|nr:hypothetical protein [Patescibacteria group bacterium]